MSENWATFLDSANTLAKHRSESVAGTPFPTLEVIPAKLTHPLFPAMHLWRPEENCSVFFKSCVYLELLHGVSLFIACIGHFWLWSKLLFLKWAKATKHLL